MVHSTFLAARSAHCRRGSHRPLEEEDHPEGPRPPRQATGAGQGASQGQSRARVTSTSDHPLGEGVADGFALRRLKAPARLSRTPKRAVRELGWAAFGEVARQLAARISTRYQPTVVLGIAKGGVFVGGALAAALKADFHAVRIEKRRRDAGSPLRAGRAAPGPHRQAGAGGG